MVPRGCIGKQRSRERAFFIDEHFRFGYLGHPWRHEVWVWGRELIDRINEISDAIGFRQIANPDC